MMMKRLSSKRRYSVCKSIVAVAVALCLWISGFITLNESAGWIPDLTWDNLYVWTGLREDMSLGDSEFRLTVMDVGNADCLLLQNGGHSALIDAGENEDGNSIVSFLNRVGIMYLDYVIATHPDADHIGGMDEVVNNIKIGTFMMAYMPEGFTPTTRVYEDLLTSLIENDVTPVEPLFGDSYPFGDAFIDILSGLSDHTETNEQSIVCRVRFGKTRFLLMGDAGKEVEEELLENGVDLRADVLKVGHHGSRSSSSEDFITAISPSIALIPCGLGNRYNHPYAETLNTLRKVSCEIYRCDFHGDIMVVSDGETITVTTEKQV